MGGDDYHELRRDQEDQVAHDLWHLEDMIVVDDGLLRILIIALHHYSLVPVKDASPKAPS